MKTNLQIAFENRWIQTIYPGYFSYSLLLSFPDILDQNFKIEHLLNFIFLHSNRTRWKSISFPWRYVIFNLGDMTRLSFEMRLNNFISQTGDWTIAFSEFRRPCLPSSLEKIPWVWHIIFSRWFAKALIKLCIAIMNRTSQPLASGF